MQDEKKINQIKALLGDLTIANGAYSDGKIGTYFDYDKVLGLLYEATNVMTDTARNPRPADLPKDIPWSEKFYDPDEKFDPYAYDGSMSLEDHETMLKHFDNDRAAGLVDDHGEPIDQPSAKDFKIRFFAAVGNYVDETEPFIESELTDRIAAATKKVDGDKSLAGWTVNKLERDIFVNFKRKPPTWMDYRPDGGLALYYDTGRRGNHVAESCKYTPRQMVLPYVDNPENESEFTEKNHRRRR